MAAARRARASGMAHATLVVWVAVGVCAQPPGAPLYRGLRLADALRSLQSQGLRLVYSSEIVQPSFTVDREPRAREPRRVLDEILEPHGLRAVDGPGDLIQVVRAPPARPRLGPARSPGSANHRDVTSRPRGVSASGPHRHQEQVEVLGPAGGGPGKMLGSFVRVSGRELEAIDGVFTSDPLQAAQALPRVAAAGDFRSELSVRGSPYRHVGLIVDSVPTRWLLHGTPDTGSTGSISMVNADAVDAIALQVGPFARLQSDSLGAELQVSLREGARGRPHARVTFGGATASVLGEGPLGPAARGSWLVAVRRSIVDWPTRRLGHEMPSGTAFGFSDLDAKLAYDVRSTQKIDVTVIAGRSTLVDLDDRSLAASRTEFASFGWRSILGSHLVLQQRTWIVDHRSRRQSAAGDPRGASSDLDAGYRGSLTARVWRGLLDTGGEVWRSHSAWSSPGGADAVNENVNGGWVLSGVDGRTWRRAGYVSVSMSPTARLAIASGLRVDATTSVAGPTLSRWLHGTWTLAPAWRIVAGAAVAYQVPATALVLAATGTRLRPERAAHVEVGITHDFSSRLRWQATIYRRAEDDLLSLPVRAPRLAGGVLDDGARIEQVRNALIGSARGLELVVERHAEDGLSGWLAYDVGRAFTADKVTRERYAADFDQPQVFTAFATAPLWGGTRAALRFRAATNVPIPGYVSSVNGSLFAGPARNQVRLPSYARLDFRLSRTFTSRCCSVTIYAEVLNVLDHRNVGPTPGTLNRDTGQFLGVVNPLFSRLPSAGVVIGF